MNEGNGKGPGETIENRKVVAPVKRRKYLVILTVIVAVIIVVAALAVVSLNSPVLKVNQAVATTVTNTNSTSVSIPLTSITQTAIWYQYSVNGTWVRFFAAKDSTGTAHVAFDECPNCYPSHQGFRQEGTTMVENCCNMGIAIADITKAGCSGGECHPAYLASNIVDGNVTISISDLAIGEYLFTR
jgi:uncharacterized membrane protein